MTDEDKRLAAFNALPMADKMRELIHGFVKLLGFMSLSDFIITSKNHYSITFDYKEAIDFLLDVTGKNDDFCIYEYEGDSYLIHKNLILSDYALYLDEEEDEEGYGALARFADLAASPLSSGQVTQRLS